MEMLVSTTERSVKSDTHQQLRRKGDVLIAKHDGWPWSPRELCEFLIVRVKGMDSLPSQEYGRYIFGDGPTLKDKILSTVKLGGDPDSWNRKFNDKVGKAKTSKEVDDAMRWWANAVKGRNVAHVGRYRFHYWKHLNDLKLMVEEIENRDTTTPICDIPWSFIEQPDRL